MCWGEIASALGAKDIDVRGIHAYTDQDRGVVCVVVDKLAAANKVLAGRGLQLAQEELSSSSWSTSRAHSALSR